MPAAAPSPFPSDPEPFDSRVIDEFAGIMNADAMRELLHDMERDVRERLLRLSETSVVPASLEAIAQDAHDIKSLGGNFGMAEMAVISGEIERAARAESLDQVAASLPALIASGNRSLAILTARPEYGGAENS
jgi:HPt (histidine-containing phosphotransfer) domain-containing protein